MGKLLEGKTIVLGITGGIAAYKAATLCSRLVSLGATVRVVMTEGATKFIAPLTLQTLSRHPVATDVFDEHDASVVQHIDLADAADLVVVAPATANIIAKMAHGIADDMLSTTLLATTAPVLIAPAMNVHMLQHPAVMANLDTLGSRGVRFVESGTGQLACGYVGKGRLAEPDEIVEVVISLLKGKKPLAGRKVLVTAGGTIERLDPVRYITNDSSGKMGFALAEAARDLGADVTLVCARTDGPPPSGVTVVRTPSAGEMLAAVMERLPEMDAVVKAAAVADYRPAERHENKMKKGAETMTLTLVRNPDILQEIGNWRYSDEGNPRRSPFVVGFAAETTDVERHALDKLARKRADLIVANDVSQEGVGFGADSNAVNVYGAEGLVLALDRQSKRRIAERLWQLIADRAGWKPSGGEGVGAL
ncbi:bifunctional phosphopantothenoylcysteine decarboxylase/phosphopantothenate--cysteine ligase CoaBC [Cohnella thailandensis]|uniref:Coenzyme A biosynthesis bifunctional protein CoaBC n=1 Tax=Cohnella thailandensis TaxID=557557 RepID=A0A841T5Z7_9BACL|nr:bifunctional phosphopantothenoylcysteine decarboxylase/phosphopantothenate--cysteine ligase CoaBC [Cohnella thailandensis]MBB6636561.1 bifunctional phosphopantothenoylcysteine decarboxylase/phosphopantothenate--cysteine ligase CoaBC [Cohnella thailandensis]MBP1973565.1 phosphopantothenoylcysteine decarboxylase/phosphopantothenate--cysteine ligase [Cohnella thailandensis]